MGQRFVDPDASPWLWVGNAWAVLLSSVFILLRVLFHRGQHDLDVLFNFISYVRLAGLHIDGPCAWLIAH